MVSQAKPKSKEYLYTEQIAPLINQITAICDQHQIPMVAGFGLDGNEGAVTYRIHEAWQLEAAICIAATVLDPEGLLKPGKTLSDMLRFAADGYEEVGH